MSMDLEFNREPKYILIARDIQNKIQNGHYKEGDRLETEIELTDKYSCSRSTLRNATSILTNYGYLDKKRGKGTLICIPDLEYDNKHTLKLFINAKNKRFITKFKKFKIIIDKEISQFLNIKDTDKILVIESLKTVNNINILWEKNYLPYKYFSQLKKSDLKNENLYEIYKKFGFIRLKATQEYIPINLNAEISKLFNNKENDLGIKIVKTVSTQTNILEYSIIIPNRQYYKISLNMVRN